MRRSATPSKIIGLPLRQFVHKKKPTRGFGNKSNIHQLITRQKCVKIYFLKQKLRIKST